MERGGGIVQTLAKPSEYSSTTHEESECLSFWVSQLEELVKRFKVDLDDLKKGSVRMLDLTNLQIEFKKMMG